MRREGNVGLLRCGGGVDLCSALVGVDGSHGVPTPAHRKSSEPCAMHKVGCLLRTAT
jgi:hypothetical protein